MTVKCLTATQKAIIAKQYLDKIFNQKDLAEVYAVSERTINRVLVEAGLATPVARIKGEAYQVMQLLKQHNHSYESLKHLLELYANAQPA